MADTKTKKIVWTQLRKPISFAAGDLNGKGLSRLTDDWLWNSRKRLAAASGAMGSIWFFYLIIEKLFSFENHIPNANLSEIVKIMGSMVIAISLLMIFLTRVKRLDSQRVMDVGLLYFIFCAWAIAVSESCKQWNLFTVIWGVSWVCLWIVVFPLVVPTSPMKMFLASFTAAALGPLALYLNAKAGNVIPDSPTLIYLMYLPNFIAALVAVYFSHVVYEFKKDLSEARSIGSYRLSQMIGKGGMGEVWLGKHQMLARPAAIKLVAPDELGNLPAAQRESTFRRFEREARATAALHSPHTIEIYDFGINEDGIFYYVMEYLDGLDLATFMKKFGRIHESRVLYWLRQIGRSLAEAHGSGLIHRDIKPANIILCQRGLDYDVIKVLDFGLVKSMGHGKVIPEEVSIKGQVFGTAGFMAPEAAMGRNDKVDSRSDIYSVGCVLYRILTGRQVFMGKTPMEVILNHVSEKPVPPSQYLLNPMNGDLEQLVLDCLAKDPRERPEDGAQLLARAEAVTLDAKWDENDARLWWRENRSKILEATQAKSPKTDAVQKSVAASHFLLGEDDETAVGKLKSRR